MLTMCHVAKQIILHVSNAACRFSAGIDRREHPGYAPEKIKYGIDRYQNETRRLYKTLDTQLEKSTSGFLVGDRLSIADIASWGWVASHREFCIAIRLLVVVY